MKKKNKEISHEIIHIYSVFLPLFRAFCRNGVICTELFKYCLTKKAPNKRYDFIESDKNSLLFVFVNNIQRGKQMKSSRIILCAALLVFAVALSSQTLQWQHYTSGKQILSLAKDANSVYVGTGQGMAIYDIQNGTTEYLNNSNSPLTRNWISSIATLGNGIVWIGTDDGIWRVEGDNWQLFNPSNTPIPSGRATKLKLESNGTLWCLSAYQSDRDYIYRYDGQTWTVFHNGNSLIPGNVIGDIEVDNAGNLYLLYYNVSSQSSGLAFFSGSTWTVHDFDSLGINAAYVSRLLHDGTYLWITSQVPELYRYEDSGVTTIDLSPLCSDNIFVTSLNLDSQNNLMLGAMIDGDTFPRIMRYINNVWQVIDPNTADSFLGSPNDVIEDSSGDLWLGTNYGLARCHNGQWQPINTTTSPLPTNNVNCLTIDNQDRLWLGLFDPFYAVSGILKAQGDDWTFYNNTENPIPNPDVSLITSDSNGKIWFTTSSPNGHNDTVTSFDGQNWQTFSSADGSFPAAIITAIKADANNNLWMAIRNISPLEYRLMKYNGTSWVQVETLDYVVNEIEVDLTGIMWLATNGGLIRYDGNNMQIFATYNSDLPNNFVQCLAIDNNNDVWVGMSNGLAKLHNGVWKVWDSVSSDLPYRNYKDLVVDDSGRIWAGTYNTGLLCFDGSNWTTYTSDNSPLLSDAVLHLAIDSQNNLWISYQTGGLSKLAIEPVSIQDELLTPVKTNLELTNYPNPFNPNTTISFRLKESVPVCMKIFNIKGQMVRELSSGNKTAGAHSIGFDGKDSQGQTLSSGIYYVRLQAGTLNETRKILLMK